MECTNPIIDGVDAVGRRCYVLGRNSKLSAKINGSAFQINIDTHSSSGVIEISVDGNVIEEIDAAELAMTNDIYFRYVTVERHLTPGARIVSLRCARGERITVSGLDGLDSRISDHLDPRSPRIITPEMIPPVSNETSKLFRHRFQEFTRLLRR
jgi:hypothetical protein